MEVSGFYKCATQKENLTVFFVGAVTFQPQAHPIAGFEL
jgi:hypothetical protein